MTKINLPAGFEWFDLELYEKHTSRYELKHWHAAFSMRSFAKAILASNVADDYALMAKKQNDRAFLEEVLIDPLSGIGPLLQISPEYKPVCPLSIGTMAAHCRTVNEYIAPKGIALEQLAFQEGDIEDEITRLSNMGLDELLGLNAQEAGVNYATYTGGVIVAEIDLSATDAVILDGVKALLDEKRRETGIDGTGKKYFSEADTSGWYRNKVLEYLDICLYCDYSGTELTLQQIGLMLFPGEYDIPLNEKIRRTVREEAERMTSRKYLSRLNAQLRSKP